MQHAEIRAKVTEIVAHIFKVSKEAIKEESTLESLGADSLNRVEFVMELEEAFGLEIKDEDAEKFSTVNDAVEYVQRNSQPT